MGIANILAGSTSDIVVATSRVPAFDDDIQNPIYGYRSFGLLSCITVEQALPPPLFDHRQELFAVHSVEDPKTERFNKVWHTCGLDLANHFIIIFTNISRHHSRHASPLLYSTFSNSPSVISSRNSPVGFDRTPSPLVSEDTGFRLFGLGETSPTGPASNSPATTSGHADDLDHNLAPMQPPAHESYRDLLAAICAQRGLPAATVRDAQCKNNTKRLLPMVLNHRCMTEVLIVLGIQDHRDCHTPGKKVNINNIEHTFAGVVKAFQWSPESYKHKCQWFGWAAQAAHLYRWEGPTPADGQSHRSYLYYLSLKLLICRHRCEQPVQNMARYQIFLGPRRSSRSWTIPD